MCRQKVSNSVSKRLELIGVDMEHYSGKSMRLGGISAALTAKVQVPVLYLQPGHGSQYAAQNYMMPKGCVVRKLCCSRSVRGLFADEMAFSEWN